MLQCGRRGLASMLLEYEPIAAERIRLLLRLRLYEAALQAAVDCHETELVASVVVSLLHQMLANAAIESSDVSPTAVRSLSGSRLQRVCVCVPAFLVYSSRRAFAFCMLDCLKYI